MSQSCFFPPTATTEIYTLSLHDALPISSTAVARRCPMRPRCPLKVPRRRYSSWPRSRISAALRATADCRQDRKSTRLNSSHQIISYAVFCLKKKREHIEAVEEMVYATEG